MMKWLLVLSLLFPSLISPGWGKNLEAAKEHAVKEKKYILLNFSGSDWCIPCRHMTATIFESPVFEAYAAEHLLLVRADFPRLKKNRLEKSQEQYNEALAIQYNSEGKFPLTLLLDAEGKVIRKWDGDPQTDAQKFVSFLEEAIQNAR